MDPCLLSCSPGQLSLLLNLVGLLARYKMTHHSHHFSGSNAAISLIFAEYLNRVMWGHAHTEANPRDIPEWAVKLTAVLAVLVIAILSVAARNLGSRAAVVFTTVKVSSCYLSCYHWR